MDRVADLVGIQWKYSELRFYRLTAKNLAYKHTTILRCIEFPNAIADRPLASLHLALIKIGAQMTHHDEVFAFQLVEVTNTSPKARAFYNLREAQILIEQWRKHYNTKRPHSALGYRPPAPETIIPMDYRPMMH